MNTLFSVTHSSAFSIWTKGTIANKFGARTYEKLFFWVNSYQPWRQFSNWASIRHLTFSHFQIAQGTQKLKAALEESFKSSTALSRRPQIEKSTLSELMLNSFILRDCMQIGLSHKGVRGMAKIMVLRNESTLIHSAWCREDLVSRIQDVICVQRPLVAPIS